MTPSKTGSAPECTLVAAAKPTRDIATARKLAAEHAMGFRLIGQFVFEFSQLDFAIRFVLANRLGLSEDYGDIVTAPYDFAMLCNVTQVVLCKQWPGRERRIKKLFKDCHKLNDERVHVAHGMWTLGRDGPVARKVSRRSLQWEVFFEQEGKLRGLTVEIQRLMAEVLTVAE